MVLDLVLVPPQSCLTTKSGGVANGKLERYELVCVRLYLPFFASSLYAETQTHFLMFAVILYNANVSNHFTSSPQFAGSSLQRLHG